MIKVTCLLLVSALFYQFDAYAQPVRNNLHFFSDQEKNKTALAQRLNLTPSQRKEIAKLRDQRLELKRLAAEVRALRKQLAHMLKEQESKPDTLRSHVEKLNKKSSDLNSMRVEGVIKLRAILSQEQLRILRKVLQSKHNNAP